MNSILAITYWSYNEPLVQSGALPYLRIISEYLPENSKIFLFTLEKKSFKISDENLKGIRKELAEKRITLISKDYNHFGIKAVINWILFLIQLTAFCLLNRIKFIHAFGTPAGAIGYVLSSITGKKLIIDCLEPHAEAMVESGNWSRKSSAFKILFLLEKMQIKKANAVLIHNEGMVSYIKEKYNINLTRYFIRTNFVNLNILFPTPEKINLLKSELAIKANEIICIYTGKIGGIYLDNELFAFIKIAEQYWENRFKMILLTDTDPVLLDKFILLNKIKSSSIISKFVPHSKVKDYLAISDFAICPVRPIPTKRFCSPIKTGEYWALGLPVVIPANIGDDSDIIENEKIGAVIPQLNKKEYLIAIQKIEILIQPENALQLKKKIISIAHKYRNINDIRGIYKELYS